MFGGQAHDGQNILLMPRNHRANWIDLIDAGVRAVKDARIRVKANFPFDVALEFNLDFSRVVTHGTPDEPSAALAEMDSNWAGRRKDSRPISREQVVRA
ncbi:MAG: hypothetical protein AB1898_06075 [Acidobacteriota bacterium]